MSHILRATTLAQFAQEFLYLILFSLDAYVLVRVRQTRKALKSIVDNSAMPQHMIDHSYFQTIPVGASDMDMPPATRHATNDLDSMTLHGSASSTSRSTRSPQ
ncbi:hypothetical protein BDR06DRAFT_955133 [Suillus hirtellus]|nr:hypothetical protein BDR06DRAFT_955133 [Suillus hirtellus]